MEDKKIKKAQIDFEKSLRQYNERLEKQKVDKEFSNLLKAIDDCISHNGLLDEDIRPFLSDLWVDAACDVAVGVYLCMRQLFSTAYGDGLMDILKP